MKGTEAFQELLPLLGDEPVVHANGFICRESFALKDREANFYMIGSWGWHLLSDWVWLYASRTER